MYKLKSGALQFTVFVSVLIALLLSGLILFAYTFLYMKEQSKGAIENIQFSDTGVFLLLEHQENNSDTVISDFIKKENQTIKLHLSKWGVFEKAYALTQFRKKRFVKTALIGSLIDSNESPTLFLQETQNPLTIVGNTSIRGIAYLPSEEVKSGYIAGNSYYGAQLIYGSIKKSSSVLPKLKKNFIDGLVFYMKEYRPIKEAEFINLEASPKIINSFKTQTKGIYSKEAIVLESRVITGNIIIKSDTLIKVKRNALLKDIILIAPIIEIEDGTVGNFQALASKRIFLGKECHLNYPSALMLFQENKNTSNIESDNIFDNQIFINSGSSVRGSVCYIQTKEELDFRTQIVLEKDARIKGQVYCNGNFELRGTVSGSVYTKLFVANQSGSTFVNHIYNGTIENENIPTVFGGILFEDEPKTVMKWLY